MSSRIAGGKHDGVYIWKKNFLVDKNSVGFLKKDLAVLGFNGDKISDFDPSLVLDSALQVTKKTKNEFVNVYFNKHLADDARMKEEDCPF